MTEELHRYFRKKFQCIFFLLLGFILTEQATALTIKLGSLAPAGSLWAQALNKLQAEWLKASNKTVVLKLYGGGSVGDEEDIVRKIRYGQLNAAGLTGTALNRIYPGAVAVQIPRLVHNMEEHKYLMDKLKPVFDKEFQKKNYKVLFWVHTGWVYLFSRNPVSTFNDVKNQKIYVSETSQDTITAFKKLGCTPVALKDIDIVLQLQTGGVDALLTSPLYILSYHLYNTTRHMSSLKWGPFLGAVVISLPVWNKIPANVQLKLEAVTERIAGEMEGEWIKSEEDAIAGMQKYGLLLHDAGNETEWDKTIAEGFKLTVTGAEEEYLLNQAQDYLKTYRNAVHK